MTRVPEGGGAGELGKVLSQPLFGQPFHQYEESHRDEKPRPRARRNWPNPSSSTVNAAVPSVATINRFPIKPCRSVIMR
jgi:hypothetical protein